VPIVADAAVAIRGDLSRFSGDLNKARAQTETLGQSLKSALSPRNLAIGGVLAGGFAALQVAQFFGDAVGAASDLNETMTKTSQIFGEDALPALEEWAEGASTAFGQSKQQALDAASTFAIFGKSAGLAGDDLVGFSQELTELSSDFASFFNTSPEEAITAIGAALRGESEPIRRYGILLDEATLRQRALTLGIIETTTQALTPQQRVLAAQAEIIAQSADAQGDFARTSEGLANQQRILNAELANATAEIGQALLPVVVDVVTAINDVIQSVRAWVDENAALITSIGEATGATIAAIQTLIDFTIALAAVGQGRYQDAYAAIESATNRLAEANRAATIKVTEDVAKQGKAWDQYQQQITGAVPGVAAAAGDLASQVPDAVEREQPRVRQAAYDTMVEYAAGLLDAQNEPKMAIDTLLRVQEEALTGAEEVARLKGQLASQELANGLSSNIPAVRAAAYAARRAITDRLAELTGDAWGYGNNIGNQMAQGLYSSIPNIEGAVRAAGYTIRGGLGIQSEPEDTHSPLRGITMWGGNIVKTIAQGMLHDLGVGKGAANALASALTPALMPVTASAQFQPTSMAAVGTGGTGGDTNFILNVEGQPKRIGSRDDVLDAWEQIGGFDGRSVVR
jgi:hypothetical protein